MLDIVMQGNDDKYFNSKKPYGHTGKILSFFQQLQALLYSIQKNWPNHPRLFFVHSKPLTQKYIDLLNKHKTNIVHRACKCREDDIIETCTIQRLDLLRNGGFGASHTLYLDLDILCLKPPILDFSKDVQVMYAGAGYDPTWGKIYANLGTPLREPEYDLKGNACQVYHAKNKVNLFPFFNFGISFINNKFAESIVDRWEHNIKEIKKTSKACFAAQAAMSITIIQSTKNWSLLPPGCNFLPGAIRDPQKWTGKISLYHYCGSRPTLDVNIYKQYFNHA
jgi:hypothetical protein